MLWILIQRRLEPLLKNLKLETHLLLLRGWELILDMFIILLTFLKVCLQRN
nr:MAG TPA: hypothetical protein [Caudoviricetes sp.]